MIFTNKHKYSIIKQPYFIMQKGRNMKYIFKPIKKSELAFCNGCSCKSGNCNCKGGNSKYKNSQSATVK